MEYFTKQKGVIVNKINDGANTFLWVLYVIANQNSGLQNEDKTISVKK